MAARHNWGMYFPAFGAWERAYGGHYEVEEAIKPPPFPGFKSRKITTPFGEVKIAVDTHPLDTTKWVKIAERKFFSSCGVRKHHMEEKFVTETHIKLGDTMWDDDEEWTTSSRVEVTVDDGEVVIDDLNNWGIDLAQEFMALEQEIAVLVTDYDRHQYGRPFPHDPKFEELRLAAIEEARASSSADAGGILKIIATQEERDSWQEEEPAPIQEKPSVKRKVVTVADCAPPESPFAALRGKFK